MKSRDIWHPDLPRHCRVIPYPIRQKPGNRHIIKGFPDLMCARAAFGLRAWGKALRNMLSSMAWLWGQCPGLMPQDQRPRRQQ